MPASPFSPPYALDATDLAALLMNDAAKAIWTGDVVRPFLAMAFRELGDEFRVIGAPDLAVYTNVNYTANTSPSLLATVTDMIVPLKCEEADSSAGPFIPMAESKWELPNDVGSMLRYWSWRMGTVRVPPCTANRVVRLHYLKTWYPITSDLDEIVPNNALNFLGQRTAGLVAKYLAENPTRAAQLENDAARSLALITQVLVKNQQGIGVRRRPMRASFARRRYLR